MYLVIHVGYVIVSEVSHDGTMFRANPRVLHERTRGFSRQNHVSCNARVLRRRPQGFSRLQHVFRKSTCITLSFPRFLMTRQYFL